LLQGSHEKEVMQNKIKARIDPEKVEALTPLLRTLGVEEETLFPIKVLGTQEEQPLLFRMKRQPVPTRPEMVVELIVDAVRTPAVLRALEAFQKKTRAEAAGIEVLPVEEMQSL
jgi:nitrogen regulatory protein PII